MGRKFDKVKRHKKKIFAAAVILIAIALYTRHVQTYGPGKLSFNSFKTRATQDAKIIWKSGGNFTQKVKAYLGNLRKGADAGVNMTVAGRKRSKRRKGSKRRSRKGYPSRPYSGYGISRKRRKRRTRRRRKYPSFRHRSDAQLKENIVYVGESKGFNLYDFDYKNKNHGAGRYRGVMAQEVEKINPRAVTCGSDGYKSVDYGMLGLTMKTVAIST